MCCPYRDASSETHQLPSCRRGVLVLGLWLLLNPLLDPGQVLHRLLEHVCPGKPLKHSATPGVRHKAAKDVGEEDVCIGQLQEPHTQAAEQEVN